MTTVNIEALSQYSVSHISTLDGLSQNEVTSIIQDKYGFMWFGTRGGLNRFDGYQFKIFKPQHNQPDGLKSASIERLLIDCNQNLLIGTKTGGCSIFDFNEDDFRHWNYPENFPYRVTSILEDDKGNLWYGGWFKGLWKYEKNIDTYKPIIENKRIKSIAQANNGTIWFGTNDGLYYLENNVAIKVEKVGLFDVNEILVDNAEPFIWYTGWDAGLGKYNYKNNTLEIYDKTINKNLKVDHTYSLCQTVDGELFVGTWGKGLFIFDKEKEIFDPVDLQIEERNKNKLDNKVILDIYEDKHGNIWVGTDGGGIVHLFPSNGFQSKVIKTKQGIIQSQVNDIYVDSLDRKWLVTKGKGVFVSSGEGFNQVEFSPNEKIPSENVTAKKIFKGLDNRIWISKDNELLIVKENDYSGIEMQRPIELFSSKDMSEVIKVLDMHFSENEVWIGTQQNGLFRFMKGEKRYIRTNHFHVLSNESFIADNRVTSIFKDYNKDLWIATYKGLLKFNVIDSSFIPLEELLLTDTHLIGNIVLSTRVDSSFIWYGTPSGLNRLELTKNGKYKVSTYTKNNGLTDDYIYAIQDDYQGNIWISTNAGISSINKKTEVILNFDNPGDLGNMGYSEACSFQDQNGEIYFGNDNGFTYFHPDKIIRDQIEPRVVFTNFKVLNEDIKVSNDGVLNQSINEVESLVLKSDENEFSLEFSALDFTAFKKKLYAYSLTRNNDTSWTYIGNKHYISFKNLRSGEYFLRVKGTNASGEWSSHVRTVRLVILPPVWRTWYALLAYALVVFGTIMLILRNQRRQNRLLNEIEKEQLEREKEQQLIDYKIRFFTNISHELRTPLSLISAPIAELLSIDVAGKSMDYLISKLGLVQKNIGRLENLVNQLIEFRKVDTNNIELNIREIEVVSFIREIREKFIELASEKEVTFETNFAVKEQVLFIDTERIEIVLSNLLSNAFKFCANPGKVTLSLNVLEDFIVIKIVNDGKGIAQSDMKHLFERFYQGETNASVRSSGIGLNLVKEYIELHKGKVEVESELNGLTTFTISLKLGSNHLESKIIRNSVKSKLNNIEPEKEVRNVRTKSVNTKGKGSKIVVVEDNDELRDYLTELLSRQHVVVTEKDGSLGYETIINEKPDLVISDVMMPNMDGFELCEKVKTTISTEHIPVLLLTAKNMKEDELLGLKKGADLYIIKPFNPEVLQEQVRMLLSSRKKLKEKYSKNVKLEASNLDISNEESEIIAKVIQLIEENMDDPALDMETLAAKLSMSGSTFYRRIKKLTNLSPREFIISIKMKAATRFLTESDNTVTEIAGKLGYNDLKTFRRNFSEHFGITPTKYRSENSN